MAHGGSGKRPIAGREPSAARPPRLAGPRPQPSPSRPCPKLPYNLLPRPLPEAVPGAESGYLVRSACGSFVCQARSPLPRCAQPPAPPGKRDPGSRNAARNATLAASSGPTSAAMAAPTLPPDAAARSPTILLGTASRGFPSGHRPVPPPRASPTPARARTRCATGDAAAKRVGGAGGELDIVTRGNPAV